MLALKQAAAIAGLRRLPRLVADLVLPPTCPACQAAVGDAQALCSRCWSAIRFIAPPLCPVYGTPFAYELGEGILSAEALADPPPFRRARAAAIYGDVARDLVHQLKYHDRPDLAEVMAIAMHRAGRELLSECALIVPVPLYRWRLWQRRFNQAAVLAASLAGLSGVPHRSAGAAAGQADPPPGRPHRHAARGECPRRVPRAGLDARQRLRRNLFFSSTTSTRPAPLPRPRRVRCSAPEPKRSTC